MKDTKQNRSGFYNKAAHTLRNNKAFLFLLPGLFGFTLFYIWPFIYSMGYAFADKPINGNFAGIQNFIELINNKSYLKGLKNTIFFIGVSVPVNMLLSLIVAMAINKLKMGKTYFSLLFLIPLVIPSGSMVLFWKSLFAIDGTINGFLHTLVIQPINWLETSNVRFVIILIFIWKNLGYNMVLFISGLSNIPKQYYEAGQVDGAGRFDVFRHITVVYLLPTFVLVIIMSIINSFKVFKEIYLITGSYPHDSIYILQHFMNNMFNSLDYQKLTTATVILVFCITVLTQLLFKAERGVSQ